MKPAGVKEIAQLAGVHQNTIRRWCNRGIIVCRRDFNNCRVFPNVDETMKRIHGLMTGEISLDHNQKGG